MLVAEIRSHKRDQTIVLAVIEYDGKKMRAIKGGNSFLTDAFKDGISGLKGKIFYPKDGEDFMRALPIHFRGGRVTAVLTKKD